MKKGLSSPLYITGRCQQSGKFLLGGLFKMQDTAGYPIDCCIDECKERGYHPDFLEAMCDCWLNDCLKFESFLRQITSQVPDANFRERFCECGSIILNKFPKMRQTRNPVDTVCRYILSKKRLGKTVDLSRNI